MTRVIKSVGMILATVVLVLNIKSVMENRETKQSNSAGGIVIDDSGRILIISQDETNWSLPKGHVETREMDLETAKREIYEESGIHNLVFVKDLGSYQRSALDNDCEIKTIHMFLFRTSETELKPLRSDSSEARWVDRATALQLLTHPKDKEFFLSAIK